MSPPLYVCNASPIIAFERLQSTDLLHDLVGRLLIPTAVRIEAFADRPLPDWIEVRTVAQALPQNVLAPRLGPGEREAIVLALEVAPCILLLDDLPARRAAEALDIQVMGVVGLLLLAKRRQLLAEIRPRLDSLIAMDFRISGRLYRNALRDAMEL